MDLIDRMVNRLSLAEGARLKPYDDKTGKEIEHNVTIGIGTNLSNGISQKTARILLFGGLDTAVSDAQAVFGYRGYGLLPEPVKEAFLDMLYQMGRGRFMGFKKMIVAAKANDWPGVKREMLDSDWARGIHKNRAEKIAELIP